MKNALEFLQAYYTGYTIQEYNRATKTWIDIDLNSFSLKEIQRDLEYLRIKPDSFKKALFVSSQQSIENSSVTNYLPKIAVPKEGRYKVTIEELPND